MVGPAGTRKTTETSMYVPLVKISVKKYIRDDSKMAPRLLDGGFSEGRVQNGRQKNVHLCLACVRALGLVYHSWPRRSLETYRGREL